MQCWNLRWETDPMKELFRLCEGYHNVFQSCMMGGDRDKGTKWWSSPPHFNAFNVMCDNNNEHKPWKPVQTESGLHFPTSEEAAYPYLLCEELHMWLKRPQYQWALYNWNRWNNNRSNRLQLHCNVSTWFFGTWK